MGVCERLKENFLEELENSIRGWKEKSNLLLDEGSNDEAIFEGIKVNIGDIFYKLFNVSYKKSCLGSESDHIKLQRLSKTYFNFFHSIPAPWAEKMKKDKEYNMMEEYYKEELKLETAEFIKNLFTKHYDRICGEI